MRRCHFQLEECYNWCAGCRLSPQRPFCLPCVSILPNKSSSSLTFCQGNKLETEKYKVKVHNHSTHGNTMSTIWLLHGRSCINKSWICYSQRVNNMQNNIPNNVPNNIPNNFLNHVLNNILNNILLFQGERLLKAASDGKFQDVRTCLEKGADINYADEVRACSRYGGVKSIKF